MKVKLRMPKKELGILKDFILIPKEQQDYFIDKLKTLQPENPLELISEISENVDLEEEDVRRFLKFIDSFYLNYYIFNKSIRSQDDYIQEVIIDSVKGHDIELQIDEHTKELLRQILDMEESIGIVSKVSSLINENPNNFANVRIITDLRHIYYNNPTKIPRYSLIKHNLVITYIDINSRLKEKFFTLELDDLLELRRIVERAIEKEKALKTLCDQKDIIILKEVDWFE